MPSFRNVYKQQGERLKTFGEGTLLCTALGFGVASRMANA